VSLSTSRSQRLRRVIQLIVGVLFGIAVGELLSSAIGTSTAALGVIVFVTLAITVATSTGFFASGMLFANQAAASAILVVTLHRHGTGAERAVDALVGVGILLGVGLFPPQPLKLVHHTERRLLADLATTVEQAVDMLSRSVDPTAEWALARGAEIHQRLAELVSNQATARAVVRVAPRRWRLRSVVEAELARLGGFDALAEAVLGTARAAIRPLEGSSPLPKPLRDDLAAIGAELRGLAISEQPWSNVALDAARAIAHPTPARAASEQVDRAAVVDSLLQTSARGLVSIAAGEQSER